MIVIDRVALALSDPIRLRILDLLAAGRDAACCSPANAEAPEAICACDLLAALDIAPSKLSYHMKELRESGLTRERKRGRWHYYTLDTAALDGFRAALEQRYLSDRAMAQRRVPMSNDAANTTEADATRASENAEITEAVRARYGGIAVSVLQGQEQAASCCGDTSASADAACCGGSATTTGDRISAGLYAANELDGVPLKAALASLGCGNPTALAELHAGETVLDLGSGGGIDVLLSARRVGPTGFAYGLDMTDEMLDLARKNAAEADATNVAFLKGDIAAIPLPDASVDVIISNCVINLAADKAPVLREAFRVLKPGGRFAVSDIVIHGGLPADLLDTAELRRDLSSWAGCIAGALTDEEYRSGLIAAGFTDIDLEVTRHYSVSDLGTPTPAWVARLGDDLATRVVASFASTFVRARKPTA
ncbi:MAG: SAM-dependent methyltransferase [Ktedonobacterales bacterium]|jgi:ubiquinone/menaquinone biosynthesis C-methylase UbiE/DNA-binding transcriptional ArsR family regulator|nr:MAG: SAM-dependent methyltransferase [Ktedonobacterales bacterium]